MLLQDNLEGLQHLAIPVTNLSVTRAFYEQFGFKETLNEEVTVAGEVVKVYKKLAGI
ncbi:MAG: hypothetical protein MUO42_04035 [Anaerolineaceae bacterium]|nr:hypothetical protein [Anaerolineaceae bacterium]